MTYKTKEHLFHLSVSQRLVHSANAEEGKGKRKRKRKKKTQNAELILLSREMATKIKTVMD